MQFSSELCQFSTGFVAVLQFHLVVQGAECAGLITVSIFAESGRSLGCWKAQNCNVPNIEWELHMRQILNQNGNAPNWMRIRSIPRPIARTHCHLRHPQAHAHTGTTRHFSIALGAQPHSTTKYFSQETNALVKVKTQSTTSPHNQPRPYQPVMRRHHLR